MDSHSLDRRTLQALCKKNKIPANITNVAMADALAALQHVEGIEEFINPSEINAPQSPERPEIGSPSIPLTRGRVSTLRKATKEITSSISVTRTRRGTRRVVSGDLNQENQDVMVNETPAVQSGRRRAPATSSRRKLETQMKDAEDEEKNLGQGKDGVSKTRAVQDSASVQRVYSTRRSVRMLEKTMGELTLKEKVTIKPVDIVDFITEETKNLLEPAKEENVHGVDAGSHVHTDSNDCLEKMNQNTDHALLVTEGNQEDGVRDNDKCHNYVAHGSDSGLVLGKVRDEKSDDLNALSGSADDENTNDEGCSDFPVTKLTSEAVVNGVSEIENEKSLIFNQTSLPARVSDNTIVATVGEEENTEDYSMNVAEDGDHQIMTLDSKSFSEENLENAEKEGCEIPVYCEDSFEDSEQLGPKFTATELSYINSVTQESPKEVDTEWSSENPITEESSEEIDNEGMKYKTEALIDVEVTESLESAIKPEIEFAVTNNSCSPAPVERPTPVKKTVPHCFLLYTDGEEVKGGIQSPFQTMSASRNSNKKQVTVEKPVLLMEEVDKENIDRKMEPVKERGNLESKSLRELKKMFKTLTIVDAKKKKDDENVINEHLEGKLRQPLGKLPENQVMASN